MIATKFINSFRESISIEGLELVTNFFILFSRFECSLKNSGFVQPNNDGKVNPDWDLFVKSIRQNYDRSEKEREVETAIEYLMNFPPHIQSFENGSIVWREKRLDTNTPQINKLLSSIKDIRNNLFHGGKFQGVYEEDISRNYLLINSAIIILNHWLNYDERVSDNFLKPAIL